MTSLRPKKKEPMTQKKKNVHPFCLAETKHKHVVFIFDVRLHRVRVALVSVNTKIVKATVTVKLFVLFAAVLRTNRHVLKSVYTRLFHEYAQKTNMKATW